MVRQRNDATKDASNEWNEVNFAQYNPSTRRADSSQIFRRSSSIVLSY